MPENTALLSLLTVALSLKGRLIQSFLDMKKAPLQVRTKRVRVTLKFKMVEQYFWMRWGSFLWERKRDCCGYWKRESIFGLVHLKCKKTNVRVVAATNVDVFEAVKKGKFREDLYYRLNTVPLRIPSLRERKEDINLLFRKFIVDFSDKYRSPGVQLTPDAQELLMNYSWPGNVRQLKNIAEQIAVLEKERVVDASILAKYLPMEQQKSTLPVFVKDGGKEDFSERDLLYKVLFDMKKDMVDLKNW